MPTTDPSLVWTERTSMYRPGSVWELPALQSTVHVPSGLQTVSPGKIAWCAKAALAVSTTATEAMDRTTPSMTSRRHAVGFAGCVRDTFNATPLGLARRAHRTGTSGPVSPLLPSPALPGDRPEGEDHRSHSCAAVRNIRRRGCTPPIVVVRNRPAERSTRWCVDPVATRAGSHWERATDA